MDLIDLHCHILPGVDDGATDLADAVGMARQAVADGITVVCATPHIRHDHDVAIAWLRERVRRLETALTDLGVRVDIALGGEVAETALGHLGATDLRVVSLGGTGRWVLLEPAPGPLSASLIVAVEKLPVGWAHGTSRVSPPAASSSPRTTAPISPRTNPHTSGRRRTRGPSERPTHPAHLDACGSHLRRPGAARRRP